MAIHDDIHRSASDLLLSHCREAYADEAETWRDLERKAQATVGIVGVFFAGAFVILRESGPIQATEAVLLTIALIALCASAVFALSSMRVADVGSIETIEKVQQCARFVVSAGSDEDAKERIRLFVHERSDGWKAVCSSLANENERKANTVHRSQKCLRVAVLVVLVLAVVKIWSPSVERTTGSDSARSSHGSTPSSTRLDGPSALSTLVSVGRRSE